MKPSLHNQHTPWLPQSDPEQVHAMAFQMITGHFTQRIVNPNLQPPTFQTPVIEKFGVEMFKASTPDFSTPESLLKSPGLKGSLLKQFGVGRPEVQTWG